MCFHHRACGGCTKIMSPLDRPRSNQNPISRAVSGLGTRIGLSAVEPRDTSIAQCGCNVPDGKVTKSAARFGKWRGAPLTTQDSVA